MLKKEAWQRMFEEKLSKDPFLPHPIAVMQVIQESLYLDDSTTLQELIERMRFVREALCCSASATVSVRSAGEMFTLFITRAPTAIESAKSFDEVRDILKSRGVDFMETIKPFPVTIAKLTQGLFRECLIPIIIITQSWNQCVLQACIEALHQGFTFKVFVTEGLPLSQGGAMVKELRDAGVSAELVLDAGTAYYVEQSTLVMVGAEAVCPNGGIIAKVGTATITATAKVLHRRVYVLVESYRFTDYHTPLNNRSLTPQEMYGPLVTSKPLDVTPNVDYTPPENICRLYTDIGQLHPIALQENINTMFT